MLEIILSNNFMITLLSVKHLYGYEETIVGHLQFRSLGFKVYSNLVKDSIGRIMLVNYV